MSGYLLKRLFWMLPLLIGISLISFLIMHLAPGDITSTEASFNPKASEESRQKLRAIYNLDKPVIVQYGLWMKRMVTLDFGTSLPVINVRCFGKPRIKMAMSVKA